MGNNVAQGACGEDLTWVLDADGVLTISGTGDMQDYSFGDEALWIAHKDRIKALVLEEGITSIGNHAFEGCTGLTEVHIPVGVTGIGEYAFFGCSGLQNLYFYDETPPTIGENAFGSTGLTTVYVPPTRYTLYKSTISEKLPEGITFKGLPTVEPEPQGPTCTIGTAEATVSGEELGDYINKGVLLLMAAYDSEGRLLGVVDTVVTNVNGGYMTIEAEGIAEVRLFVTDWSFAPVKAPYVFEK